MSDKPNRKLAVHELPAAEYQRMDWIAKPERGTTLDEMLVPAYWAHTAKSLKPLDRIEVRPGDGEWWAELLVRAVEPAAVKVHVLRHIEFDRKVSVAASAVEAPEGYEFKFRGKRAWCVIRLSDNVILKEDEHSKPAIAAWLDRHLAVLAE